MGITTKSEFSAIQQIDFETLQNKLETLQQNVHDFNRFMREDESINLTCAHLLYHFGLVRSLTNLIRRPGRDFDNIELLKINKLGADLINPKFKIKC